MILYVANLRGQADKLAKVQEEFSEVIRYQTNKIKSKQVFRNASVELEGKRKEEGEGEREKHPGAFSESGNVMFLDLGGSHMDV